MATDPLDIVNEFFSHGIDEPPWPRDKGGMEYWEKKVCALAERCAKAEDECEALTAQLKARDEPKKPKPKPTWTCPTCGKRFNHGTQCAHWYFDSQVALGPLRRPPPLGETAGQRLWREAGEEGGDDE